MKLILFIVIIYLKVNVILKAAIIVYAVQIKLVFFKRAWYNLLSIVYEMNV